VIAVPRGVEWRPRRADPEKPLMARGREQHIEHLLRRAGFGATEEEVERYAQMPYVSAVERLIDFDRVDDDVDARIGQPGMAGVTARASGGFQPNTNIDDARQRWLFRMVHSRRPLQEKMALFWHNHFATAYLKIAGAFNGAEATRMMAAKPAEDPSGVVGQLELFRQHALGNFRDLLIAVAQDPAMLVWLDGRTNVRGRPQENFARELMELFTMGVGTFPEADVYAGARVFTGWNLARRNNAYTFNYNAGQHDTEAKEFSFPVYTNGSRVIPARSGAQGMQDGVDLINAVARHPETGPRLARKLYSFFMNEADAPDAGLIGEVAQLYYSSGFEIAPMVRRLLTSRQFHDEANWYKRYSWPVEFVARSLKEVGWNGFSLAGALTPLVNMGQQLFEPPDVNGWELGRGWFSSGAMLARMNFAAQLATNQKFNLRDLARRDGRTPEALVSLVLDRLTPAEFSTGAYNALLDYVRAGGPWAASDDQLATKTAGLVHLVVGSGDYQLV
jgi:uncharacterized protein (DUF1800 family)